MNNCIVVNLFGAPGAGKSTGAAYIFSMLKFQGINAELITEFAKDMVWEENGEVFKPNNQCYLFGEQYYRLSRCKDKVDVIVTDSPLPLSILYNKGDVLKESFNITVMDCFNSFYNINFLLLRDKPYNPKGRLQTESESDALVGDLMKLIKERDIECSVLKGTQENYDEIVELILHLLKESTDGEST